MEPKNETTENLIATIEEMNRRITELESRRDETKWLEQAFRQRTHELSERMKELECIFNLLQLSLKLDDPFEGGAEKMIHIIREGWQYPNVTGVRIRWDGKEFRSLDFKDIRSRQSEPIIVKGKRRGEVEIGYTVDKPGIWQGPFLREEAKLLRSISLYLSLVIDRLDKDRPAESR
jgi:hypothetical protein